MENEQQDFSIKSSQPVEPVVKSNKKLVTALSVMIILLLIVVAVLGYLLITKDDDVSNNQQTPQSQVVDEQQQVTEDLAEESTLVVPQGYMQFSGDGYSFYYPSVWGEVRETDDSDNIVYRAEFTAKENAQVYLNSGNQDFTNGGRGGALWDCVGFIFTGDKSHACLAVAITAENGVSDRALETYSVVLAQDNSQVITDKYSFFDTPVEQILFNPDSSLYYGGTLVISDPTQEDSAALTAIAPTFSTAQQEGM